MTLAYVIAIKEQRYIFIVYIYIYISMKSEYMKSKIFNKVIIPKVIPRVARKIEKIQQALS
jgi:hypothetical protein